MLSPVCLFVYLFFFFFFLLMLFWEKRARSKSTLGKSSADDIFKYFAASDLSPYCLPMSLIWDTRHK